jgi:hypothetical protein
MKISTLSEETQNKLDECISKIIPIIDKYFPEFRKYWDMKDPDAFESRIYMTFYLELIHSDFFKGKT